MIFFPKLRLAAWALPAVAVLFLSCGVSNLLALEDPGTEIPKIGVHATLGTKLDLSIPFTDADGRAVTLRDLVPKNRPAIIVPAYYDCPRLCGMVQAGVAELLNKIELALGPDFTVITALHALPLLPPYR